FVRSFFYFLLLYYAVKHYINSGLEVFKGWVFEGLTIYQSGSVFYYCTLSPDSFFLTYYVLMSFHQEKHIRFVSCFILRLHFNPGFCEFFFSGGFVCNLFVL